MRPFGRLSIITLMMAAVFGIRAEARNYLYPQMRYQDANSYALGGVTVPLTDSVMNLLMNNPAGLAKYGGLQAEFFNLMLDANSASLSNIGAATGSQTSLNSFASTLNANKNQQYGMGGGVSSAYAWHGFGFGILMQERVRAASDGTKIYYDTVSETIPTVGVGVPLARGIVRLGYSFQYINHTSGSSSTDATTGPYAYMNGLSEGHAFSNNASVDFTFPFTYLPTFSFMARNIFGLHYFSSSLMARAKSPVGVPKDEPMVIDAALNYMIRVTGTMKTNWYFQIIDPFQTMDVPIMDRLHFGAELAFNQSFSIRAGATGIQPTAGFGYNGDNSSINLAWYHEKSPLPIGDPYDSRWVLQYTVKFKERAARDRSKEK